MNDLLRAVVSKIAWIGASSQDSEEIRLQKSLLVLSSMLVIPAGVFWGVVYLLMNEPLAGMIPLSYSVVTFFSVVLYGLTRRYRLFRSTQLCLILLLPFLLMLALGGFVNSSAVILWSLLCPMGAMMFAEQKHAPRWLAAYIGLIILSGVLQPYLRPGNNLPSSMMTIFFVLNISVVSGFVFILLFHFVNEKNQAYQLLHQEQQKSEALLLNVLPRKIAAILKQENRIIADDYESASILFADLVGFTPLTAELTPTDMVRLLNKISCRFDELVEKYGVEKIRMIGDNYMVASGVPEPRPDHAQVLACLALEMNAYLETLPAVNGKPIRFRIGINSGPVIAGVVGNKKFAYDVWGDTVNIASRMESQGEPGKIQITQSTYKLLADQFVCEPHGVISIKGKGPMETWFLLGMKEPAPQLAA